MRTALAAILIAAAGVLPQAHASLDLSRAMLELAPAVASSFRHAAQNKPAAAKGCKSRGGVRRTRSYYTSVCV